MARDSATAPGYREGLLRGRRDGGTVETSYPDEWGWPLLVDGKSPLAADHWDRHVWDRDLGREVWG